MLTPRVVQCICDRHRGAGSDGILLDERTSTSPSFALRIFNPDGSEAEKSGNGLRIFSRYLYDTQQVPLNSPFCIKTRGGLVKSEVLKNGKIVRVEMGRVSFKSSDIPVDTFDDEVLNKRLIIKDTTLTFSAASVGNPHCVIFVESLEQARSMAMQFGPEIEKHGFFPNHTNVQFAYVINQQHLGVEIWERGAGYTLASGTSACAAAAVAHRLGHCERALTVRMPGGALIIHISPNYEVEMTGPVTYVGEFVLGDEMLEVVE